MIRRKGLSLLFLVVLLCSSLVLQGCEAIGSIFQVLTKVFAKVKEVLSAPETIQTIQAAGKATQAVGEAMGSGMDDIIGVNPDTGKLEFDKSKPMMSSGLEGLGTKYGVISSNQGKSKPMMSSGLEGLGTKYGVISSNQGKSKNAQVLDDGTSGNFDDNVQNQINTKKEAAGDSLAYKFGTGITNFGKGVVDVTKKVVNETQPIWDPIGTAIDTYQVIKGKKQPTNGFQSGLKNFVDGLTGKPEEKKPVPKPLIVWT